MKALPGRWYGTSRVEEELGIPLVTSLNVRMFLLYKAKDLYCSTEPDLLFRLVYIHLIAIKLLFLGPMSCILDTYYIYP